MGTNVIKPTVEYNEEDYKLMMNTNFEPAYHLSQLVHPLLKASGSGQIVFISSVAGLVSGGVGTLYGITKGLFLTNEFCFINIINCDYVI